MLHTHAYAAMMSGQKCVAIAAARETTRIATGLSPPEQLCEASVALAAYALQGEIALRFSRPRLAAGRALEAERVYREDLAQHPENGESLLGLAFSLHAQRRVDEARLVQEPFSIAFADTDVTIPGSRY